MPVTITSQSGDYQRVIQDPNLVVCVEVGNNMVRHKKAGELEVGDKLCFWRTRPHGPGVPVESVVVE